MHETQTSSALILKTIPLIVATAMTTLMIGIGMHADAATLNYSIAANNLQNTKTMATDSERLANNDVPIVPFEIAVSDQDIDDLKQRLANTRLPDQLANTSWEYGTELRYLRELLDYWQNDFDWRAQETQLNQFDQFKTEIDGLEMHFIHQRSSNPDAIPLMIVHGWPGSISEFTKIIGPLTDPASHGGDLTDSFHIIAPSLPGFGFSGIPTEPGYSPEKIAHLLAALMEKIGYQRYAIAGGDWGAIINRYLANNYPDRMIGLHSNMMLAGAPSDPEQRAAVTDEENALRTARGSFMQDERAYQQIQNCYAGATFAMVQSLARPHMRAMAAAGVLFVMNLGGLGLGPTVIGFMNDWLTPRFGIEAIRVSLLIIGIPHLAAAIFGILAARTLREDIARTQS